MLFSAFGLIEEVPEVKLWSSDICWTASFSFQYVFYVCERKGEFDIRSGVNFDLGGLYANHPLQSKDS